MTLRDTMREVYALNERLIGMLVQAAHTGHSGTLHLVKHLQQILTRMTPDGCAWVARRAFVLVDVEFGSVRWWRQVAATRPARSRPVGSGVGALPRAPAIQLARTTLVLAWYVVRTHRTAAGFLFGMHPAVADVIAALSLPQIERIAEQHFHRARPRWEDRPALWRELIEGAESPNVRRARDLNLRGLQLIAAALVMPEGRFSARSQTAL